jgi:hypothetical protein
MADDLEKRVDALEAEPEQLPDLDLRVVYHQTYFDSSGARRSRQLPATYDLTQPFLPMGRGPRKMRVLYPLEDAADPGSGGVTDLDDKEVPGESRGLS